MAEYTGKSEYQFPVPATLTKPYLLLWSKGYNLSTIGEILSYIAIYETVEGCPDLKTEADREMIEGVLPYAPVECWALYENVQYGIS